LIYGIAVWGNSYNKYLCKLDVLQKKAVRTRTRSVYNEHASPLFRMVNILKFRDLYDLQINGIMFDFVHRNLSTTLLGLFEYHAEGHGLNTRHRNDPKLPKFQTELVRRSLLYRGPQEWMNLDAEIKNATSKKHSKINSAYRKCVCIRKSMNNPIPCT
jgi:hypothetical protein